MIHRAVCLVMLCGGAAAARAQGQTDVAAAARAVRQHVADLQRAERELMPASGASGLRRPDDAILERRDRARAEIARDLDRLITAGPGGRAAIQRLAAELPGAELVRRAEIRAAIAADDPAAVLRLADRLRVSMPRDTQLLRWRAEAYDALGQTAEALRARQAYWELAPEDDGGWRALVHAHERAGSLARLRESVARIRILHPESRVVREQEIEILHRLGRYDEAARIAAATRGDRL